MLVTLAGGLVPNCHWQRFRWSQYYRKHYNRWTVGSSTCIKLNISLGCNPFKPLWGFVASFNNLCWQICQFLTSGKKKIFSGAFLLRGTRLGWTNYFASGKKMKNIFSNRFSKMSYIQRNMSGGNIPMLNKDPADIRSRFWHVSVLELNANLIV